jgi:formamidopyrimidine-DNA glycosylase
MPELPEVETTRRGIAPCLEGQRIARVTVRERRLRWPVARGLESKLRGQMVRSVERRAKYLLLRTDPGTALIHLGMTGSLKLVIAQEPPDKHDHFDIVMESGVILRFNDARRFGSFLWGGRQPFTHPLLARLGPEPLDTQFSGDYLYRASRGRRVAIKPHLMNANIVVGVGNIYASEALFRAGIHPKRAAGRISGPRMDKLARAVKDVLAESIRARLFSSGAARLWTRRGTMSALFGARSGGRARPAVEFLLHPMPALAWLVQYTRPSPPPRGSLAASTWPDA